MKYMGNKQRIADDILTAIGVNENDTFVDLFCGSLSVTQRTKCAKNIANDKNKYLIAMWGGLLEGKEYPNVITKEHYSEVRDDYNKSGGKYTDDYIGWIGWMGSYNGRFFDGGYSGHDVKGRDYISEQIRNTTKQLDELRSKHIKLSSAEYYDVDIPENAVVYCDIPYRDTTQYSTSKGFDYEKFYDWCRSNNDRYRIYVSEYNMPDDFKCIWSKEVTNAMNTKNTYKPIEKVMI